MKPKLGLALILHSSLFANNFSVTESSHGCHLIEIV
jgi:hypothetical protein